MPTPVDNHKHSNRMTPAGQLPHDHATDWVRELQRLVASSDSLAADARLAVIATIDSFAAEDGFLSQPATQARAQLAVALTETGADTTPPSRAGTLLSALRQTFQREPSPQRIQAA